MLTHGSLFSGIGGFDLGFQWAGIPTLWQVEQDPYCQAVLARHFPTTQRYGDIRSVHGVLAHAKRGGCRTDRISRGMDQVSSTGTDLTCSPTQCDSCLAPVNIISGGFPCQPYSVAGKRRGSADDRALWPEMRRVIAGVQPRWVVAENVPGIIQMALDQVWSDLEALGYTVGAVTIPACAVDAPHRRERLWIVGYATDDGQSPAKISRSPASRSNNCQARSEQTSKPQRSSKQYVNVADTRPHSMAFHRQSGQDQTTRSSELSENDSRQLWPTEPNVGRVAHGIPHRVHRLRALGNAIVPQIAEEIGRMILAVEASHE